MLKLKSCIFALLLAAAAAAPAAYAADVDGYPGFNTSTDPGLFVWRTPSGGYQVRLLAGGDWRGFEGTFETSGNVWGITAVTLESGDAVSTPSSGKVGVKFNAKNLDVDGVAFNLPAGADLCLRGQGGTTTAYLGSNAVPVSLPASLSGSNACSTGAGTGGDGAGDGLFVSRGSNGVWELTLYSESNPAAFSGTIEATQSINWLRQVSFESDDSAWKTDSKTATMNMSTWPGGYDGVDVSLPDGAGACLRDATGGSSTVYLGTSLADAVKVTTPVDLTNSGACGGTSDGGGDEKGSDGRKFNPGHYIALMRGNDSLTTMAASITPGVKGFLKRYTWRELEPSEGQYNFSEMKSDLDFAASQGMHLIVMVEDKTFVNEVPTPAYLSWLTRRNKAGGWTVARWAPKVVTRHKALLSAIGARFDGHPNFEGVATQETAPSLSNAELDATGYTPEKFRDALIDILSHGAQVLPKSRMFFFMNYLPRNQNYIGDVADAVAAKGVVLGGPDVMPDEHSLQEHTYPFYREFAGKMPLFGQVEPICYHHRHKDQTQGTYWSPAQLFRYARDNLDVNYMFWVNYPKAAYWDSYDYYDTLPVISNNPTFN